MVIEKYNNKKHFRALTRILLRRRAYMPDESEMPKYGFVALEGDIPVAFAFLRRVEGGAAQLDGLTSNPECEGNLRNEALDAVVMSCITKAKHLNITQLIAFTKDESTFKRSGRIGFVELPHHLIAFDLNRKV